MKRMLLMLALALALLFIASGVAWADDVVQNDVTTGEIALLLAPLVAAATAIERVIEMIFDWYERTILDVRDLIKRADTAVTDYVTWVRKQVATYQQAVYSKPDNADPKEVKKAESQLALAEQRLQDYLKSPLYTNSKRRLTLILGVVFGLIVAFAAQLQMFSLLGIDLAGAAGAKEGFWAWFLDGVDMFLTGLIIGTGSAPVHSLIGILQKSKDAVDEARAVWRGKSLKELEGILQQLQGRYEATVPADARGETSELDIGRLADRLLR